MNFYDLIQGSMQFDGAALRLILSPEVQRLREIALINAPTPTCPSLSDVRRFGHTLAVSNLAGRAGGEIGELSPDRRSLLHVSAVLHDVGTPPFGHLLEYTLNERFEWDHERQLRSVLAGDYRPENIYHQIYHGASLRVRDILDREGIDWREVAETAQGKPPVGGFLNADLDLDNIDNVARMAVHLGLDISGLNVFGLASKIRGDGTLVLDPEAVGQVELWQNLRKRCYHILAFDPPTLAAQAMLTDAMGIALDSGLIGKEYWHYTEADLLGRLEQQEPTRSPIQRLLRGDMYECIGIYWVDGESPRRQWDASLKHQVVAELDRELRGGARTSVYAFRDRGAMCKAVTLRGESGERIVVGEDSQSLICAVFRASGHEVKPGWHEAAAQAVVSSLGCDRAALLPIPGKEEPYGVARQASLPF